MRCNSLFLAAALVTAACSSAGSSEPVDPTFEAVMEQVLVPKCTFGACHNSQAVAASLDLTTEAACDMLVDRPSCLFPARKRVIPGNPGESFLFHKLAGQGLDEAPASDCGFGTAVTNKLMPYGAPELDDRELELVHSWIELGASCTGAGGPQIASLEASSTTPLSGDEIMVTVKLDRPAPAGGQVISLTTNNMALAMPSKVTVSEGMTSTSFPAGANRPSPRFTLRAQTGRSTKDVVLRIGGLVIAEALANPAGGIDDQYQWIKIHNTTNYPIVLDGYRIQVGQSDYNLIGVPLTGTIARNACIVVGGPLASGANGEPLFSHVHDFQPDLPYAGAQATGFALFDTIVPALNNFATPVDTMLVGANNDARLPGADGEPARPLCATPADGRSALRDATLGSCSEMYPQPRACP